MCDGKTEAWVDGSLFFHPQSADDILDGAIGKRTPLSVDHVRDEMGLTRDQVEAIIAVVEDRLGGTVRRVSAMNDWMHVRIPESLMHTHISPSVIGSNDLLERSLLKSLDERLKLVVHHVASALQDADLERLVSHLMLVPPYDRDAKKLLRSDDTESTAQASIAAAKGSSSGQAKTSQHLTGRSLLQEEDDDNNFPGYYMLPRQVSYEMFTSNKSDAVKNIGAWYASPVMFLQCAGDGAPYLVGASTDNCFSNFDVTLQPALGVVGSKSMEPLTIRFDDLSKYRKTCAELPEVCKIKLPGPVSITEDTYVFGFPLYKYAVPNALYTGTGILAFNSSQFNGVFDDINLGTSIFNYYNASALTIRELYGVDPLIQGSPEMIQASVLVIGLEDTAVNETAASEYLDLLGLEPHSKLLISNFGVPNNVSVCENNDCGETMLDVQAMQSFAPNATTYFTPSSEGKSDEETVQLVLEYLDELVNADPRAQVSSLSWSADYSSSLPIETLEGILKKLAAMGMTILVSSGDAGASGSDDGCLKPFSGGPLVGDIILESWPTMSPWVTSVGGTQLLAIGESMETTEVVCSSLTDGGITSGGGFSSTRLNVSTPEWQRPFVERYLKENNASTFSGFPTSATPGYNPNGRGFPDISAYSAWFPNLNADGSLGISSGTSLSAPLMAALFTLANQKLKTDGYEFIGYANPMLYWMAESCPEAFTDITIGDNQAGDSSRPCLYGFPTAPGWDPVTGLGSIKFDPFVTCAKKYQDFLKNPKTEPDTSVTSAAWVLGFCSSNIVGIVTQMAMALYVINFA